MTNIIYSDNTKKGIKSVNPGTTSILVIASVERIIGVDDRQNAFAQCKDTIESVEFESGSQLRIIEPYAFYECKKLSSIDLRLCEKLETIETRAFSYCSLTEIYLPSVSLKSIKGHAFYSSNLNTINIPASVTHIGDSCFYSSLLTSITFDANIQIETLGWYSLRETKIQELNLPQSLKGFHAKVVEGVTSLKTISVPEANAYLKSIDGVLYNKKITVALCCPAGRTKALSIPGTVETISDLFLMYSKITDVTIPDSVTAIKSHAFAHSSVTSIVLPKKLTTLENCAFLSSKKLKAVTFPDNLTSLQNLVFSDCAFESIEIPEGITSIGDQCFSSNKNLKLVILPSTLTKLGGGVFSQCHKDIEVKFNNNKNLFIDKQFIIMNTNKTVINNYIGGDEGVKIKIEYTVETIMANAFRGSKIETVTFTENSVLKKILQSAFENCYFLKSINIPASVTTISSNAFYSCKKLESLTLPIGLNSIGMSAFAFTGVKFVIFQDSNIIKFPENLFDTCMNLSRIEVPPTLVSIGKKCFYKCVSLKLVELPSSLNAFNDSVFYESGVEKITIQEGCQMTQITDYSFYKAHSLATFVIPSTVLSIGYMAFKETNITQVDLPIGCTTIGGFCFSNCPSLTTINIQNESKLETVGLSAFEGSLALEKINGGNKFYCVENEALFTANRENIIVFPPASKIRFFYFPQCVKKISCSSFYGCKNIISVMIPDNSITSIETRAFANCVSLKTINIPESVKDIGVDAFLGCKNLKCGVIVDEKQIKEKLISEGKLKPNAFKECSADISVKCNPFSVKLPLVTCFLLLF